MGTITRVDLEVLERLGGSTADVHRAIVRSSGRVVVVKRAPWDDTEARDGLTREVGVLSRVSHHHLVRLLAATDDEDGRIVVLQHAPGGSLAARLHHTVLAPAPVAELGAGVARALAALHREGIVHRDVHPGNVLFDAELRPLLADLDHALDPLGAPLPRDGQAVGHPDHVDLDAPPAATPAADLAGLASTLWTAVVGSPPGHDAPLPSHADVPPALHTVLERLRDGSLDAAGAAAQLDATALELAVGGATPSSPVPGATLHGTSSATPAGTRRWDPPVTTAATRGPSVHSQTSDASDSRHRHPVRRIAVAALLGLLAVGGLLSGLRHAGTEPVAVAAPPPCVAPDRPADAVLADLDGNGCSEAVVLSDGVLATEDGTWSLGRSGDRLLVGDWDGDGRWSPGLHRPSTGAVYLFDGLPGDGPLTSRPAQVVPVGAEPVVVTDGARHVVVADR